MLDEGFVLPSKHKYGLFYVERIVILKNTYANFFSLHPHKGCYRPKRHDCIIQKLMIFFLAQKCKTFSGPKPNKPCIFPFDYKGRTHFDCITVEHDQLWCSTEVDANGSHIDGNWGNCGDECFSGN